MTGPWHVQVLPLPAHDGWLLCCPEHPEIVIHTTTLDDMGDKIAQAIATAIGRSDTRGMVVSFNYPRGDITLYQLTREADGSISCNQVPGFRLSGASRTQDLVQSIAVADGVAPDTVGIVFDPSD